MRPIVNEPHRFLREHAGRHAAGRVNPAGDVGGRVAQLERFQLAAQRHTLFQLAQIGLLEALGQFGLAGEDNREQLVGRRFDVGEQPHLFEQFGA